MIREIFLNIAGAETRGIWNLKTGEVQILMYGGIAVESNYSKLSYVEQNITNDGFKEVKFDYLDDGARYVIQESSGKILRFAAKSVIANPDGSVFINIGDDFDDGSEYHDLRSFCSREDVDASQLNTSQDLGSVNSSFCHDPRLSKSYHSEDPSSLNASYDSEAEWREAQTAVEFFQSLIKKPVSSLPHARSDKKLATQPDENPVDDLPLETSSSDDKVDQLGVTTQHQKSIEENFFTLFRRSASVGELLEVVPRSHDYSELEGPANDNPLDDLPLETSSLCGNDDKVNPLGDLTHCSDGESIAYV